MNEQKTLTMRQEPYRERLPATHAGLVHKFVILYRKRENGEVLVERVKLFIRTQIYPDGSLGGFFLDIKGAGSMAHGMASAWATSCSLGLQYGIPLKVYVSKFSNWRFEPEGIVEHKDGDHDIKIAKSIVDYVARWLASQYLASGE